jgi:MATE family multidrug resistance protein
MSTTKELKVSNLNEHEEPLIADPSKKTPDGYKRSPKRNIEAKRITMKKMVKIVLPTKPQLIEESVKKKLLQSLIKNIFLNIITSMCFQMLHNINLICLGYADDSLLQINAAQLGQAYIKTFGFTFCIGSIGAFEFLGAEALMTKNLEMLHLVYNQAKIFSILIFLIFMLPLCYISNYTMFFAGINEELAETAGVYVRYSLVAMFLSIFNHINFKFLQMLGKYYLVMFINAIVLVIHTIVCICFINAFKLGVLGAGISMIISYTLNFIISSYFLTQYNPCENKDVFELDTDSLSSSTFYYYVKIALPSGIINSINYVVYDATIFTAAFLSKEALCANVILLNFITSVYLFVFCFTSPLIQNLTLYSQGRERIKTWYNIKNILILTIAICCFISAIILIFAYSIGYIFVRDVLTVEYVGNVIRWYSIFIFFDWAKTMFNTSIRGLSKHSSMDLICSLILLFIFLPLGLLMTFSFKLGYKGFWYGNYISMVLLTAICGLYFFFLDAEGEKKAFHLEKEKKNKEITVDED